MLSCQQRLAFILRGARAIASREFQEEAWFPGGRYVSSPDEIYQVMMEDSRPDSFFQEFGETFTASQMQSWSDFRSQLECYYDGMPLKADPLAVLNDPNWNSVRKAAQKFVEAFATSAPENSIL